MAAEPPTTLRLQSELTLGAFSLSIDQSLDLSGVTGLYGVSGSGKSTLLRIIAGLESRARGYVEFAGASWQSSSSFVPAHRRNVSYVFQDARLFEHLSVAGNLNYAASRCKSPAGEFTVEAVTVAFGLALMLDRSPSSLSAGERQRVAMARSILSRPGLLLLDEPMASLDSERRREIFPFIESLAARFAIPTIYVSHSTEEIARLANRVVVLSNGRVVSRGDTGEILSRINPDDRESLDDPISILAATIVSHDTADEMTYLDCQGQRLAVPLLDKTAGSTVRLHIRSSDVALATIRPEGLSIRNVLAGKVDEILPTGYAAFAVVTVSIGSSKIHAKLTRAAVRDLALVRDMPVYALLKTASFKH